MIGWGSDRQDGQEESASGDERPSALTSDDFAKRTTLAMRSSHDGSKRPGAAFRSWDFVALRKADAGWMQTISSLLLLPSTFHQ